MAFQPESPVYDSGVFQLETTTPVQGGVGGASNAPLLNLANRTAYLKQHIDALEAAASGYANLNSPAFTGTPTTPNVALGDRSGKIANTQFVQDTVYSMLTKSVAGGSNVTLTAAEAGAGILNLTGTLTANISVIVPNSAKSWIVANNTGGAFTLTVKTAAGSGVAVTQGRATTLYCDATNVSDQRTDFPSIAMTGNPTAPTQASGDNSTKVASTGFVFNATDGMATVNVAGGSDVTITSAQAGSAIINLTGALTANINLLMPAQTGQWVIANNSTGAFSITCKTAAGTGVVLPVAAAVLVYGDGTNIYAASAAGQTSFKLQSFAPAAGTTTLTVTGGYTVGNVLVEKNGTLLEPADFTATDGSTITVAATTAGDTFTVYCFSSFNVANAVQKSGDTMTGALTLSGNATAALHAVPKQQLDAQTVGRLLNVQVFNTAGTFTYTPTTGTNTIVVEAVGGGGGSGGVPATGAGQVAISGGGGSGSYFKSLLTSGFSGATVVVGAGGSAGAAGGNGGTGGTTTFAGFVAAGGGGSIAGVVSTPPIGQGGGSGGGVPTDGNLVNAAGRPGDIGYAFLSGSAIGGTGASSIFGGGRNSAINTSGLAGGAPGAGASGSSNTPSQAAARTGSAGAPGIVIIYEYA